MGIHWAEAQTLPGSIQAKKTVWGSSTPFLSHPHPEAEWPREHWSQPCLAEPASPAPRVAEAPSRRQDSPRAQLLSGTEAEAVAAENRGGVGETEDQGMGDCLQPHAARTVHSRPQGRSPAPGVLRKLR